jgi:hypothetical protein
MHAFLTEADQEQIVECARMAMKNEKTTQT